MNFEKIIKILAIAIIILLCFELGFAYFTNIKIKEQQKAQEIKTQLKQEVQNKINEKADETQIPNTGSGTPASDTKNPINEKPLDPRTRPAPTPPVRK